MKKSGTQSRDLSPLTSRRRGFGPLVHMCRFVGIFRAGNSCLPNQRSAETAERRVAAKGRARMGVKDQIHRSICD